MFESKKKDDEFLLLLKELAYKEADNIKTSATSEEIDRLEVYDLDPDDPHSCMYGQMTGDCFSSRAEELISKCTETYIVPGVTGSRLSEAEQLADVVNHPTELRNWSPIEVFVFRARREELKALVEYIKEEI